MPYQVARGNQTREQILDAIIKYMEIHGYAPSFREIGEAAGLSSTASIKSHIDKLVIEGKLESDNECTPRALRVPGYRFVKESELERQQGWWIPEDEYCDAWHCSNCDHEVNEDGYPGEHYCSNCGAKMRSGKEMGYDW